MKAIGSGWYILGFVLCLAGACTPALPPGVSHAHARAEKLSESGIPDAAAEAWQRAQTTLAKADSAAREKDAEAANHFSDLAQIQMDTAQAEAERIALDARARKQEKTRSTLATKIEQLKTLIEVLEQERAVSRLRSHVISVVAESRREAAASEAYRARFRGEKSDRARRAVAGQYFERALLFAEIVEGYITLGVLEPEAAGTLAPSRSGLETAFEGSDLFEVEERSGTLVAAAERLISGAWTRTNTGEPFSSAVTRMEALLNDAHISFERETLGLAVQLEATPRNANRAPAPLLFAKLRPILETSPTLIVLLTAAPKEKSPVSAEKNSREQALRLAEQLGASGVDSDRIRARGCSQFAPFPSLAEGKSPALLLLVPVPTPTQKK